MDNGIATPMPGIVPSFRVNPGANGPGVVGPSDAGKLPVKRPERARFCSPKPDTSRNINNYQLCFLQVRSYLNQHYEYSVCLPLCFIALHFSPTVRNIEIA